MRRLACLIIAALGAGVVGMGACSSERREPARDVAPAPTGHLVGVYPENFQCESVAPIAEVSTALGGQVRAVEGAISPPRGVARACNYLLELGGDAGPPEAWFFDIDCRDRALELADALFEQYRTGTAADIEAYAAARDAGITLTRDGGPPPKAPEEARDVEVGAKGLDHHGQGLIFVDDDTPCYVRVVGPDAARRLSLARMLAKNLTLEKAPMTPRAAPAK